MADRSLPLSPIASAAAIRALTRLLPLLLFLVVTASAGAATYYVSPSGNDRSKGTSPDTAWQSINQVNTAGLQPGDVVLFEGGASFSGSLYFPAGSGGTAEAPITLGSFGTGRATIAAGSGNGFYAHNSAGLHLRDLIFAGSGMSSNNGAGVMFYNDLGGATKLALIRIENVRVTGFGKEGIVIGSWNGASGYRDVQVIGVEVHDNRKDGLVTYSDGLYGLENVRVSDSRFYNNPGIAGRADPTGNGLVLGGVDGAVVENSAAWNNGSANTNAAGPVGIWAYRSNNVVVQFCESFDNRSAGGDGGGFDLDGGVTNSVLQYNYSHGNDGAGFGLFQYAGAPGYGNNVVRYNVSQNDARQRLAGISVWGASAGDLVRDSQIYHNVVFMDHAAGSRPALQLFGSHYENIRVHNNILITTGGSPIIDIQAGYGKVFLQGNNYWSSGSGFLVLWNGAGYGSLSGWRSATGQEILSGQPVGFNVDPRLEAAGTAPALGGGSLSEVLSGYRLQPDSPMIGQGLDLQGLFGLEPGPHDLFGSPLTGGGAPDIGVHRFRTLQLSPLTFADWQEVHFDASQLNNPDISGPDATPAGDGIPNLLKYALGGEPWERATALLPKEGMEDNRLTLTFSRPASLPGIEYEVQVSHDLVSWTRSAGSEMVTPASDLTEEVTVLDAVSAKDAKARFMRLLVRQLD